MVSRVRATEVAGPARAGTSAKGQNGIDDVAFLHGCRRACTLGSPLSDQDAGDEHQGSAQEHLNSRGHERHVH